MIVATVIALVIFNCKYQFIGALLKTITAEGLIQGWLFFHGYIHREKKRDKEALTVMYIKGRKRYMPRPYIELKRSVEDPQYTKAHGGVIMMKEISLDCPEVLKEREQVKKDYDALMQMISNIPWVSWK